jgi:hypothetical protein
VGFSHTRTTSLLLSRAPSKRVPLRLAHTPLYCPNDAAESSAFSKEASCSREAGGQGQEGSAVGGSVGASGSGVAAPNQLSISIRWAQINSILLSSSRHPHPRQHTPPTEKPAPQPPSSTVGTAPQRRSAAAPQLCSTMAETAPPPTSRSAPSKLVPKQFVSLRSVPFSTAPRAVARANWDPTSLLPEKSLPCSKQPGSSRQQQAAAGSSSEVLAGRRVRWQLPQASARQLQLTPARALHPPASARR